MKRASKSSLTTQYIVSFGAVLLAANILLGFLLTRKSSEMVRTLVRNHMLSLSNTAADLVDGDVIGGFTEADVGTPAYEAIYEDLSAFQYNAAIKYIYAVRKAEGTRFTFTVDADPNDPAAFGDDVTLSDGLTVAWTGVAAVDTELTTDRWGTYYTAWSPITNSAGEVVGVIGVDFDSAWYDEQVMKNTTFILLFSVLFTLVGAAIFLLINNRVRRRFNDLSDELTMLSNDVEALTRELMENSGQKAAPALPGKKGDEIVTLREKIRAMHGEMERYLEYTHAQVNTDALTRVGNTTAYLERQKTLDAGILDGSARFSVAVFDINDLKHVNDKYGHACGDRVIRLAAAAIAGAFGQENTYRIGGDEFLAVAEDLEQTQLAALLDRVSEATERLNQENREYEAKVSLSQGLACFLPGQDHSFRDVFVRADKKMYERKAEYHSSGIRD